MFPSHLQGAIHDLMIWWVKIAQFLFQDISWRYSILSLGSPTSVGSSQAFQRNNFYKAAILYHHPLQHGAIKALVIKQDLIDFLSEDEWPLPIMVRAQQKSPRIKLGYASTFPGSTVQPQAHGNRASCIRYCKLRSFGSLHGALLRRSWRWFICWKGRSFLCQISINKYAVLWQIRKVDTTSLCEFQSPNPFWGSKIRWIKTHSLWIPETCASSIEDRFPNFSG